MKSSAIKVGARTYAIVSVSDEDFDVILAQKGVFDVEIKSFIDYDEQLVVVRERLQPDHKRELVLHELLHACLEDAGTQQDERSETLITILAPRLNELLPDPLFNVLSDLT